MISSIFTNYKHSNGRIYPKEVFENAYNEFLKKVKIEQRILKLKKLNEKIKDIKK